MWFQVKSENRVTGRVRSVLFGSEGTAEAFVGEHLARARKLAGYAVRGPGVSAGRWELWDLARPASLVEVVTLSRVVS